MKIALTLYTVRELLEEDFEGTMKKIADIGYRTCQISGLPQQLEPEQIRATFDKLGIKALAPHISLKALTEYIDEVIRNAKILGCDSVYLPWVDSSKLTAGWKSFADSLKPIADRLNAEGLAFGYHNHSFEFELENGRPGFEIFWESAPPNVLAEIDVYWVKHGGGDPADWIRRLGKRVVLTHWKDMSNDEFETYEEIGKGKLDWDGILAACNEVGAEYAIVELDKCPNPPLESITVSREFMLSKGLVD